MQIKSNQIYLRHIVQHEQANNSENEKESVNKTQRQDKPTLTCDLKNWKTKTTEQ